MLQRQDELKKPLPMHGQGNQEPTTWSSVSMGTQNLFMAEGQPPPPLSVAATQQPNTPMELVDLSSNLNLPQDILWR